MRGLRNRQRWIRFDGFVVNISVAADICRDEKAKKVLSKLRNDFKYSDPVSSETLTYIETFIEQLLDSLREAVEADEVSEILRLAEKTSNKLRERNQMCAMAKRH